MSIDKRLAEHLRLKEDDPETAAQRLEEDGPDVLAEIRQFELRQDRLFGGACSDEFRRAAAAKGFRIDRLLGTGGSSVVYAAHCDRFDGLVALKILRGDRLGTQLWRRFAREVSAIQSLAHPHIVPLLESGELDQRPYLVMPLIDGETLRTNSRREAARRRIFSDYRRLAAWYADVVDAVACVHAAGLIHRDIKPSNLLIDCQQHLWLSDFGLVCCPKDQGSVTREGETPGTLIYMAPEQAAGAGGLIDRRCDIYGLGVTLYELLAGRPAFDPDEPKLRSKIIRGVYKPLHKVSSDVPQPLQRIVSKAMQRYREDRYRDAEQLAADLRRFAHGGVVVARGPSPVVVFARRAAENPTAAWQIFALTVMLVSLLFIIQTSYSSSLKRTNALLAETNATLYHANNAIEASNKELLLSRRRLQFAVYAADVNAAFDGFNRRDLDMARIHINRQRPAVMGGVDAGVEWNLVNLLLQPPEGTLIGQHKGAVHEIVLTPSGIFTAGNDGRVLGFDANTYDDVFDVKLGGRVDALAYDAAGDRLLVGVNNNVDDNYPHAISLKDFAVTRIQHPIPTSIESIAVAPDGRWAAGSRYNAIDVYTADGRHLSSFPQASRNRSLWFTPAGDLVAVDRLQQDGRDMHRLIRLAGPDLSRVTPIPRTGGGLTFAASADGKRLAIANDSQVRVIDVQHQILLATVTKLHGRCTAVAISADGDDVAVGNTNGQIFRRQIPLGVSEQPQALDDRAFDETFIAASAPITALAFTDGHLILGSLDGEIRSLPTVRSLFERREKPLDVHLIDTDDRGQVYTLSGDGEVHCIDEKNLSSHTAFVTNIQTPRGLRVSPTGQRIACWNDQWCEVTASGASVPSEALSVAPFDSSLIDVCFDDDRGHIYLLGSQSLTCLDATTGRLVARVPIGTARKHRILHDRPRHRLLVCDEYNLRWFDESTLDVLSIEHNAAKIYNTAELSADHGYVALCVNDGMIEIRDLNSAATPFFLTGPRKPVESFQFLSDGERLVTWGRDNVVRIWHLRIRGQIAEWPLENKTARHVYYDEAGRKFLIFVSDDAMEVLQLGETPTSGIAN